MTITPISNLRRVGELQLVGPTADKKQVRRVWEIGLLLLVAGFLAWYRALTYPLGLGWQLLAITAMVIVLIPLHESLHGAFLYAWSKKVKFGFKWAMNLGGPVFYATSPGSLFSRNKILWISLAPQIVTVLVIPFVYLLHERWAIYCCATFAWMNLVVGAGDYTLVAYLLKFSRKTKVEDTMTGMVVYEEETPTLQKKEESVA